MTDHSAEIRQANRRALPKFLIILSAACLLGGVLGFCAAAFGLERMADGLSAAGQVFSLSVAPWLLVVCCVVEFAVCLPLYRSAKKLLAAWDGEDESVSAQAEGQISAAMWASGLITIFALFLTAAAYAGGALALKRGAGFLFSIAAFALVMVEVVLFQQKLVDLVKRISPEKQGSVYDARFQKVWMDSCDEAEKILIGQCAYKAYSAVNLTCVALWVVFTLSALFLNTGFLPLLTVCILWGVSLSVYCWNCIKLSRPGSAVL